MTGIPIGGRNVVDFGEVDAEGGRRYARILERVLREAKELQRVGRLRDPMSRREIVFLEQELRAVRVARPS
jgi:hypothetical protein